jgi:hypothetical protein
MALLEKTEQEKQHYLDVFQDLKIITEIFHLTILN